MMTRAYETKICSRIRPCTSPLLPRSPAAAASSRVTGSSVRLRFLAFLLLGVFEWTPARLRVGLGVRVRRVRVDPCEVKGRVRGQG